MNKIYSYNNKIKKDNNIQYYDLDVLKIDVDYIKKL